MALPTFGAVVLTREPEDNHLLAGKLRLRGVPVVEIPCTRTRYLAPRDPRARVNAISFFSRRGVEGLARLSWGASLLARISERNNLLCGCVGPSTAKVLEKQLVHPDIVDNKNSAASLAKAFLLRIKKGESLLAIRGTIGNAVFDCTLEDAGIRVITVEVYENSEVYLPNLSSFDVFSVMVASPSAASRLLTKYPWMRKSRFVTIGDTTRDFLTKEGIENVQIAGVEIDAQADALCNLYK